MPQYDTLCVHHNCHQLAAGHMGIIFIVRWTCTYTKCMKCTTHVHHGLNNIEEDAEAEKGERGGEKIRLNVYGYKLQTKLHAATAII